MLLTIVLVAAGVFALDRARSFFKEKGFVEKRDLTAVEERLMARLDVLERDQNWLEQQVEKTAAK